MHLISVNHCSCNNKSFLEFSGCPVFLLPLSSSEHWIPTFPTPIFSHFMQITPPLYITFRPPFGSVCNFCVSVNFFSVSVFESHIFP